MHNMFTTDQQLSGCIFVFYIQLESLSSLIANIQPITVREKSKMAATKYISGAKYVRNMIFRLCTMYMS